MSSTPGSNTNHLGSLSNGQSCIHLSSFLLCRLIESCDLCFASQAASSIPSVPIACGLFGFSLDSLFTTFWTMDIVLTRVLIRQRSSLCFHKKTPDSKVSDFLSAYDAIPKLCVNLNSARALTANHGLKPISLFNP